MEKGLSCVLSGQPFLKLAWPKRFLKSLVIVIPSANEVVLRSKTTSLAWILNQGLTVSG